MPILQLGGCPSVKFLSPACTSKLPGEGDGGLPDRCGLGKAGTWGSKRQLHKECVLTSAGRALPRGDPHHTETRYLAEDVLKPREVQAPHCPACDGCPLASWFPTTHRPLGLLDASVLTSLRATKEHLTCIRTAGPRYLSPFHQ